jgi:predicted PolB exonuclease-like 3'-5' exonuclease
MHYRQKYNQAPSKLCVLDVETLAPAAQDGGFPPWPVHRPIVASLLVADQISYGQWKFAIESVEFDDDQAAIRRIDELLAGRRAVTFNGKGFDLPVLSMTAMRASMFECRNLTDAWASPRFGGSHIDVADVIAGYGSAPRASLAMLCEAGGIPVKTNGCGGDVSTMLREQGIESVARYCEEDVASTLILFAMVQALRTNDSAYAASLIGDFVNWLHDAGLEHLEEFQKLSGNAVLERVRLLHRVEEGIGALDGRATASYFEAQSGTPLKSRQHSAS